jgi:hypothetical protein
MITLKGLITKRITSNKIITLNINPFEHNIFKETNRSCKY